MKFLVDLDRPHYLTLVLMHYINLSLPLLWGVIEVVMEVKAMGVKAVEVVTKGDGVVVKDVAFVSAFIIMVRIIQ